jgi:glutamine cyclotransferase
MNLFKILFITLSSFVFLTFSCCVHEKTESNSVPGDSVTVQKTLPKTYTFESPSANQIVSPGPKMLIKIKNSSNEQKADSVIFYLDGYLAGKISESGSEVLVSTTALSPGTKRLKMTAFFPGGKTESSSIPLKFVSDIKPKLYNYRVLGTFPHDIKAYTQGFEYHDGYFFESTGQRGESSIRKVLPGTGDFIKFRNISSEFFGEGITILNGKLYQITWRDRTGFIYDAESFEQIQKFAYENTEGWGLCNNGKEIIMSDGTNIIYFRDPQYFSINRKIEVFDNVSEVDSLNELEYINGIIYANRYMTNEIVMIDPATGKVTGKVDMRGLLKPEDLHERIDVLNGIAWDETGNRLFVTGKNWPKIYRVELIEK